MKKIISLLIIMISMVNLANGGAIIKKDHKCGQQTTRNQDSLIGFWKNDILVLDGITPGTFPDIIIQVSGPAVFIQWTAKENSGIAGFDIQRSTDLKSWINLTTLYPVASGVYEYRDIPPLDGTVYYRIRLVDNSRHEQYSIAKEVSISGYNKISIWPNPVHDVLFIQTHFNSCNIEIMDMTGRMIQKEILNNTISNIQVRSLPVGVYVLRVKYHEKIVYAVNFIKQ